ncbi:MAG TPA: YqgE/AlgH family protein [Cryomorphaceae bacterium]|nr:YqgE/AlgH family protein [Cryomorphaceae bacterium]
MDQFNIKPSNNLDPAKGRLLIAEPFMEDPYFKRSVVLMCEHNSDGTFGFILNRFVDMKLEDLLDGTPPFDSRVGIGGPVDASNLFYLHTLGDEIADSVKITEGLYMGGNFEQLKLMIMSGAIGAHEIRFFVGYSGWDKDQLISELIDEAWYITEINGLPLLDADADNLWSLALKSMGGPYANLVNFPVDPNLN